MYGIKYFRDLSNVDAGGFFDLSLLITEGLINACLVLKLFTHQFYRTYA